MSTLNKRSPNGYGWLPDLPDHRDFSYSVVAPRLAALPAKVDLRSKCSPIENQGEIGACTAPRLWLAHSSFLNSRTAAKFVDLSRLFVYYNERAIEGNNEPGQWRVFFVTELNHSPNRGLSGKRWPYKVKDFTKKPATKCYSDAKKHQITSYHRISTIDECGRVWPTDILSCLGFTVYEGFESAAVAKSGVLNLPTKRESHGRPRGHGGWIRRFAKAIIIRNSGIPIGDERLFHHPLRLSRSRQKSGRRLLDHPHERGR